MPLNNPQFWGPLRERYEADRPHRMLALDGGGIRGLLTLGILETIEDKLRASVGKGSADFRLCDYFDYIAGTSTGAIIAAGLARGMSVRELVDFYKKTGKQMFEKSFLLARLRSFYTADPLRKQLQDVFGADTTLEPQHLRCLLLVVTRNVTTDSAWPISSNPWAKYNERTRPDCNLNVPQWKIVRASTAAPVYFSPEVIQWDSDDPAKSFAFVDGGTTAYNCPAFLLARMVTEPAYGLGWPRGERKLGVVSIGTGSGPVLGATAEEPTPNVVSAAVTTLSALMSQATFDQDINCRTVGRCVYGPPLDREVGDLVPRDGQARPIPLTTDLGRAFLYARYNAELTRSGLAALGLPELDPTAVSALDSTAHMDDLVRIGEAVARQVELAHLGALVGP